MFSALAAVLKRTRRAASNSESAEAPAPLCWQPSNHPAERRETHRLPLTQDLCLVGLDDHFRVVGEPCIVQGRDISADGISFSHHRPLPYRFIGLSYQAAQGTVTTLLKLSWCRFTKPGEYASGGKFIRTETRLTLPSDWSTLGQG